MKEIPKIFIFYTSLVGHGHKRSAEAIKDAIHHYYPKYKVELINSFKLINENFEKVASFVYSSILKFTPKLTGFVYNNQNKINRNRVITNILLSFFKKPFEDLIKKENPDIIICTQALPSNIFALIKRKNNYNFSLAAALTDFHTYNFWINKETDLYFVPNDEAKDFLMKNNVEESKINVTGIPINFKNKVTKRNNKKLGLLILGGGAGIGNIKNIVYNLDSIKDLTNIYVIAGNNLNLKKVLEKSHIPKKVLGYTNNIESIYAMSDLVITKPGGLTTAELMSIPLPIIITDPLPGQEQRNTEYLIKNGVAIKIDNIKELPTIIKDLINNKEKLLNLKNNSKKLSNPDAALKVAKIINQYYHNHS